MTKDERSGGQTELQREETIRDLEPSAGVAQPPEPFTEEDMKAFAEKFQAWGNGLPERERELLHEVLLSALGPQDDAEVSGYGAGAGAMVDAAQRQKYISDLASGIAPAMSKGKVFPKVEIHFSP